MFSSSESFARTAYRCLGRLALGSSLAAAALATQACGSTPDGPSVVPDATITIAASGVTPKEVRVKAWGHVLFVNNDARPHQIASDPVNVHTDCPGLNLVGLLAPGTSGQTGALNLPRTCGFHDHINETDPAWQGRIIVE